MNRILSILLMAGVLGFAMQSEILARGGGGGGGGGGGRGGGGGGGASAARSGGGFSPSAGASRPAGASAKPAAKASTGGGQKAAAGARPAAATAAGAKAGTRPAGAKPAQAGAAGQKTGAAGATANRAATSRPSSGQLNNFLDVPAAATGAKGTAATAGAARAGGAASDFLQGGAPKVAAGTAAVAAGSRARDAGRPGTPGDNLSQNRPERIENRGERQGTRDQRRDEIRNQYNEHNPGSFWEENPGWATWAVTRPLAWATWSSVGNWCGYGSAPAASYGYGEDIYYSDGQVYSGDQPIATADEYAEQAATIAGSAPEQAPEKGGWLPLGVFALTQDGEASGAEPSIYMQLAISKQGAISGTLKNTLTGKVQPLDGMADKKSQRVAWTVVDQQRPIVETGLSNLTKDTSPALVHFADGQTQQWLMVRIPEPKE